MHYTTWFADANALKGTLPLTLAACRPTAFLGVPRVWEKIREKMLEVGKKTKGPMKALSTFAKKHAFMAAKERQLGGSGRVTIGYVLSSWVAVAHTLPALATLAFVWALLTVGCALCVCVLQVGPQDCEEEARPRPVPRVPHRRRADAAGGRSGV